MVEFTQELRHYCRNPRCRSKLPKPVESGRSAFCARGCYEGFYRTRCVVCEEPIERRSHKRFVCNKALCRNGLRDARRLGRYYPPRGASFIVKKPPKPPVASDRGIEWAIRVNSARIIGPRRVLDREIRERLRGEQN